MRHVASQQYNISIASGHYFICLHLALQPLQADDTSTNFVPTISFDSSKSILPPSSPSETPSTSSIHSNPGKGHKIERFPTLRDGVTPGTA
ncbi:hypothetical protein CC80DRAFT_263334 [Byssothecium circinans]|uniref:Uncharacterized protein n=1 Tax=Byssothecium circinans TaxID=147558 RepID=A0A6A5UA70_9PLEO|nr:hypothetical protein CC80DRAFT_263334 [Byssothecium circinans]